jgi:hypothetical protein
MDKRECMKDLFQQATNFKKEAIAEALKTNQRSTGLKQLP